MLKKVDYKEPYSWPHGMWEAGCMACERLTTCYVRGWLHGMWEAGCMACERLSTCYVRGWLYGIWNAGCMACERLITWNVERLTTWHVERLVLGSDYMAFERLTIWHVSSFWLYAMWESMMDHSELVACYRHGVSSTPATPQTPGAWSYTIPLCIDSNLLTIHHLVSNH